jgi:hypothetical protein
MTDMLKAKLHRAAAAAARATARGKLRELFLSGYPLSTDIDELVESLSEAGAEEALARIEQEKGT